jgi:hypothetical protein
MPTIELRLFREDRFAVGVAEALRVVEFGGELALVERTDEKEVRQLLDHRQRVRDPAGPEVGPNFVDFVFEFARNHRIPNTLSDAKKNKNADAAAFILYRKFFTTQALKNAARPKNASRSSGEKVGGDVT